MTWQPIETLPADGQQVLLYMPGGICIAPASSAVEMTRAEKLSVHKLDGTWPDYKKWSPTHWMPLPEPPNPPKEESNE